jgi:hypothetical protein
MKQKATAKDCEGQKGDIHGKERNNPSDTTGR